MRIAVAGGTGAVAAREVVAALVSCAERDPVDRTPDLAVPEVHRSARGALCGPGR